MAVVECKMEWHHSMSLDLHWFEYAVCCRTNASARETWNVSTDVWLMSYFSATMMQTVVSIDCPSIECDFLVYYFLLGASSFGLLQYPGELESVVAYIGILLPKNYGVIRVMCLAIVWWNKQRIPHAPRDFYRTEKLKVIKQFVMETDIRDWIENRNNFINAYKTIPSIPIVSVVLAPIWWKIRWFCPVFQPQMQLLHRASAIPIPISSQLST